MAAVDLFPNIVVFLYLLYMTQGKLQNIALGKPTDVSSLYGTSKAANGVDDNLNGTDNVGNSLMHTNVNQSSAWWTVDLKREVKQAEVKIYFRTNYKYRRNGVTLYTSMNAFSGQPSAGHLCHKVIGEKNGTGISNIVSVNCSGPWRHLMVYTETTNDEHKPILDFAEVQVLVCSDGSFGVNCTQSCGPCMNQCGRWDGSCIGGCKQGFKGTRCNETVPTENTSPNIVKPSTGDKSTKGNISQKEEKPTTSTETSTKNSQTTHIAIIVVITVIVAVAILIGIFYFRRRRPRSVNGTHQNAKTHGADPPASLSSAADPDVEASESYAQPSLNKVYENSGQAILYSNVDKHLGPVRVENLADVLNSLKSRKDGFASEFKRLPLEFKATHTDSQLPENTSKNKFKGYYPYDHNRVRLSLVAGAPCSDYINASTMHSYNRKKTYIAAQAPKKQTVGDFWRMIWEQGCQHVVMLTGLVEQDKEKCFLYWPEGTSTPLETECVRVEVVSTDVGANYTTRTMRVTSKQTGTSRTVVQYHYTTWSDHGVPETLALVKFLWTMRRETGVSRCPLLVHCSAGIGRTGTYIAVDSVLDQAREEGVVDVPGYVCAMREQRKGMIQTKEQYECVFECLLEMTKFGDTSMDVENFTTSYSSRGMESMVDRKTLREITQMAIREKSTDQPNRHRVWVDGDQAFTVRTAPSKRNLLGYLQTMSPSPGQEKLLWKLVEENNVHDVIVISTLESDVMGETGKPHKYGAMTVTPRARMEISPSLIQTPVHVTSHACTGTYNTNLRVVNVFTMTKPPTFENLSSCLLDNTRLQQVTKATTPVVVIHSGTDTKSCVLMCVLCNIVCEVLEDSRVDVIGQVRTFLRTCPDISLSEMEVERLFRFVIRLREQSSPNVYYNT